VIIYPARGGLWRLDVGGGGKPARLPFVGEDGSHPVVARTPDGRLRLVYVRAFSDTNVWRVEMPAPGAPALAPPASAISSTRAELTPDLAPDLRRVAFLSDRSGEPHIWVADSHGASATQLTTLPFASSPGFPRWSPDGKLLAFHGDPEGRPDVLVVPSTGGEPRVLTRGMINGGFPSFSRDGQWIYFTVNEMGEARIWRMPAAGGAAIQITPNAGTLAMEAPDGQTLYYVEAIQRTSSLWQLAVGGHTPPVKVLDGIVNGGFDVLEGGIYYVDRSSGNAGRFATDVAGSEARLQYFDFSTRRSTTVANNLGDVV
jgi:dipeptidyl aminopeptidase/acylaminoacyl peptidase